MVDKKIPVQQVLDDMYADKGLVSWAARDYYYRNYATPEEQKRMDREDMRDTIISIIVLSACVIGIIIAIISNL